MTKLTPEACRAGRGILKWSIRKLADEAGIAFSTIHLLEKGKSEIRAETEKAIVDAFLAQGVEITNGEGTGARLRHSERE